MLASRSSTELKLGEVGNGWNYQRNSTISSGGRDHQTVKILQHPSLTILPAICNAFSLQCVCAGSRSECLCCRVCGDHLLAYGLDVRIHPGWIAVWTLGRRWRLSDKLVRYRPASIMRSNRLDLARFYRVSPLKRPWLRRS